MPLDTLTTEYADALFNERRREIYDQEEEDLKAIRKTCIQFFRLMPHLYLPEVGKYVVKRTSKLADAKRETLLAAIERAKLPFNDVVLSEVMSAVLHFCDKQQREEIIFLADHTTHQTGLNNVSEDLKAFVATRVLTGISGVMATVKNRINATRLENLLEARNNQVVYAAALGKRWDVFISHASEDKENFVDPLTLTLQASGLSVWYDKTALTVGDRLRQRIDEGLAQCRYGVVVLSHSFFSKQWPKEELEGLCAREVNGAPGVKVILPVWHNVTKEEVMAYSPMLAGRLAANSSTGLEIVVAQLREAMGLK